MGSRRSILLRSEKEGMPHLVLGSVPVSLVIEALAANYENIGAADGARHRVAWPPRSPQHIWPVRTETPKYIVVDHACGRNIASLQTR